MMMETDCGGAINTRKICFFSAQKNSPGDIKIIRLLSAWILEINWEKHMELKQPGAMVILWLIGKEQPRFVEKKY